MAFRTLNRQGHKTKSRRNGQVSVVEVMSANVAPLHVETWFQYPDHALNSCCLWVQHLVSAGVHHSPPRWNRFLAALPMLRHRSPSCMPSYGRTSNPKATRLGHSQPASVGKNERSDRNGTLSLVWLNGAHSYRLTGGAFAETVSRVC